MACGGNLDTSYEVEDASLDALPDASPDVVAFDASPSSDASVTPVACSFPAHSFLVAFTELEGTCGVRREAIVNQYEEPINCVQDVTLDTTSCTSNLKLLCYNGCSPSINITKLQMDFTWSLNGESATGYASVVITNRKQETICVSTYSFTAR